MTMTLEQVRDKLRRYVKDADTYFNKTREALELTSAVLLADAIDAHLLSQDAEIERLSQESAQQFIRARDWAELSGKNEDRASLAESRLAAAKAEIEQLQAGLAKHVNRVCELQDRLAAANERLEAAERDAFKWQLFCADCDDAGEGNRAAINVVNDACRLGSGALERHYGQAARKGLDAAIAATQEGEE